jgi:hypothetical protein
MTSLRRKRNETIAPEAKGREPGRCFAYSGHPPHTEPAALDVRLCIAETTGSARGDIPQYCLRNRDPPIREPLDGRRNPEASIVW